MSEATMTIIVGGIALGAMIGAMYRAFYIDRE
jgi:hypothetical protein